MEDEGLTTRVTLSKMAPARDRIGTECLVVVYGDKIGRKYDMVSDILTIGRDPDSTIVLASDAVSRHHARIDRIDGVPYLSDLKSTNGTYVNDQAIQEPLPLESGLLIKVGDTIFKFLAGNDIEGEYYEEIYRTCITDGLTRIANKRTLQEYLDREVARAHRHGRRLAVLMMDLDKFKTVNDTYGHLAGDAVLREVADRIRLRIRRDELFGRYGGEEFMVVLPETDPAGALHLAESIREIVARAPVKFEGRSIPVTLSIGVALLDFQIHKTSDDVVRLADQNLYEAKRTGRNRVVG